MTIDTIEKVEIRLTLMDDKAREFAQLKKKYGLKSNAELIRLLISKETQECVPQ